LHDLKRINLGKINDLEKNSKKSLNTVTYTTSFKLGVGDKPINTG